jgi:hypothetical protein
MALRLANHFTPSPRRREDGKSFALFAESFAKLAVKVSRVFKTAKNAKSAGARKETELVAFFDSPPPGIRQRG